MTDQTGMFGADEAFDAPEDGARDKKTIAVAGGLAALLLAAGGYFLLSGSGSGSEDSEPLASSAQAQANAALRAKNAQTSAAKTAAAKTAAATPKAGVTVVPVEETIDVGRNPFVALYVEPEQAVAQTDTPGTAVTPVTPLTPETPVTPVTPVTTTPVTGGTTYVPPVVTPTTPAPTTPAAVLHKLVLQTVSPGNATTKAVGTFLVDKQTYVVEVGQVFGPKNELVVVGFQQDAKGVWTAVLRVGDSAPFDAAQGDELNVM